MKLKPLAEILKMSKEKFNEAMAPIRARAARAKADLEMSQIDAELIELETKAHELCAEPEISFKDLIGISDKVALLERKKEQYEAILKQLFPKTK